MPGVEGFVAANGKSNPRANYPLWIIAISLLAIAVCVVIDSIGRQRVRKDGGVSSAATISSDESAATAEPRAIRVATRPKREPVAGASAENSQPSNLTADNAAGPDVAVLPAAQSTVGGPQPVGYSVSGISHGSNPLGEIAGRITLKGTPPPEMILTTDPVCSRRPEPVMTRTFVVGESNGLADAVVFIKTGIDRAAISPPMNTVTVHFTNCEVQSYVTAVMTHQQVDFRDEETFEHELSVGDNSISRTLIVPRNAGQRFGFSRPRLFVRVLCLKHSWEKSFICVMENPFFAVTDKNGNFDIPNIPPGTYTIEVAHPGATGTNGVTRSVIVVAGKRAELNVALDVPNNGLSASVPERATPRD